MLENALKDELLHLLVFYCIYDAVNSCDIHRWGFVHSLLFFLIYFIITRYSAAAATATTSGATTQSGGCSHCLTYTGTHTYTDTKKKTLIRTRNQKHRLFISFLIDCCSSRRMPQKRPLSPIGSRSSLSTNYRGLPTTTSVTYTEKTSSLDTNNVNNINLNNNNQNLSPTKTFSNNYVPSNVVRQPPYTISSSTTTSTSSNSYKNDRIGGGATDSNCTTEFKKHYCLNDGICFNYTIQQNFTLLSCLCADGFYGERCEDKYLEGTYSTSKSILFFSFSYFFSYFFLSNR